MSVRFWTHFLPMSKVSQLLKTRQTWQISDHSPIWRTCQRSLNVPCLSSWTNISRTMVFCRAASRPTGSNIPQKLRCWRSRLTLSLPQVTLLVLLDLSSAFHCVDHSILLRQLELHCGLTGSVLDWLASFVQQVIYEGRLSHTVSVPFGVPQGSVLGPLLYVLYTAELSKVVTVHGLMLHQYADDSQISIAKTVSNASSGVIRLQECLCQVSSWMSSSRLRLNHKKIEVMWLGSRQQLDKLFVQQVTVVSSPVISSSHLRVIIESQLSQRTLSELLSPAEAAAASHQVIVGGRRQDTGSYIHTLYRPCLTCCMYHGVTWWCPHAVCVCVC